MMSDRAQVMGIDDHYDHYDVLTITVHLWLPPSPDPLTVSNWWQWMQCDCPDTTFGRNRHRWNCPLTPTWAQTIRDLDCNPWTVIRSQDTQRMNLADRYPRLRGRELPDWVSANPDDDTDLVQAARESFDAATDRLFDLERESLWQ